jgi:hypothetical protein
MMKRQNIVLSIVVLGTLMGALDSTIVLLAFPVITEGLHSDFITTIWIILAYLRFLSKHFFFDRFKSCTGLGRVFDAV